MHLPRRTAVSLCALALTGALAGCSDDPVYDGENIERGGVAPGGEDKNAPDGDVEPPDSP